MAGVPIAKIPTAIDLTTRISVRVLLFPADNLQPTAWELTLLVMIVILGTSILFSGIKTIRKGGKRFIKKNGLISVYAYLYVEERKSTSRNC